MKKRMCLISLMRQSKARSGVLPFGLSSELSDATSNPTIQALIRAYKESGNKEKAVETRKRAAGQKAKIFIRNSVQNSCISLKREFTSDQFKHRTDAVKSVGCLTLYADERRQLLSIVAINGLPLQIAAGTVWLFSKHGDSSISPLYFIWTWWDTTS